ncbi:artichoke-like 4 [Homarus americanus]|uniref:Artichoke-like 4 n=1 Tax=Homarus americanus TaxID=6706 RepID=A0A8J5MK24_HOMAM|nr:artichoke-like 4 [Homarus americanus]
MVRRHAGMLGAVAAVWVLVWPLITTAQETPGSGCPRWEDNPWCPCYNNDDGIFMECPMVSLETVASALSLVREPIKSLSIYDLETNVASFPSGIFGKSAGVVNLQISHSNIENVADGSLRGLESTLEKLSIQHCKLSAVPQAALHKLSKLQELNLESNNITDLPSFIFTKVNIQKLSLKGNMISLISDFAFDDLEESLQELNLINNDLKQLPLTSLQKLKNIKRLEVAWNHISELDIDPALPLPSLEYFDLSSNKIHKIKSKSLAGVPGLISLSLYMNFISSVAKNAFKENSLLETLFLGHNSIRELDQDTFTHTPLIRIIDLSSNNIQVIQGGLFCNLPKLEELVLSRNNIREITRETFENSSSIKVLNLEHNAIRFIELETFREMTQLETLLLSHNNIQEIYPRLFMANGNLHTLKLDHNRINELNEITFKNTTQLRKLFLQKNKIAMIKRGLFSRTTELNELHMQNNKIEVVATGAFSSLQKLEHLSLQENEIFVLPDTLSHDVSALRYLRVSGNNLNSLHQQALSGQGQLDFLWLDRNNISVIVEGVFSDLTYLRHLHLEENHIANIEDNVFINMTDLRKLFLSQNFLESVNEKTFHGLKSLTELYLNKNNIKEIARNAFQSLTNLDKLDLSENELTVIKKEYFETELPIKQLNIDHAHVGEIEEGSFEALMSLESLSLRGNDLHHLDEGFLKVTQLRNLDLSSNSFQILDVNSFVGLPNLETLNLNDCDIENIPEKFFDASMALKSLDLGRNRLTYLKPTSFMGLSDLTKLDLSRNSAGLNSCRSFLITTKLEVLSVSGNPMRDLCPALGQLQNLKELYASNILMNDVQISTMEQLQHLEVLDVSDNMVTDFPTGSFRGSSLRRLNLAENHLLQLPDSMFFDGMTNLKSLNISGNPLHRLTGPAVARGVTLDTLEELEATHTNLTVLTSFELSHMPALRSLNLQRGAISKVSPGAFKSLSQLSTLNLGHNMLEILPRERLRGMVTLTHLNLTRNRLKKLDQLPTDSNNLKGLEEVILRDNWVTVIHPHALQHLPRLSLLDLSHNNLEVLRTIVLKPVEKTLESLYLNGNPVTCGCETVELWAWLLNHPAQVHNPHDITCDLPETLRGQSFLLMSSSTFCPQPVILRLAIQDIQSQSLLVSWQASNSSAVYGFKVTYQTPDGEAAGAEVTSSPTLGLASRTFLLEELQPSTEYQEEGARCSRGQTLPLPASPATGTSGGRVGLILGATVAAALLLGVFVALIWYRKCRSGDNQYDHEPTKRPNGVPPDYYSHYQARPNHHEEEEFAC